MASLGQEVIGQILYKMCEVPHVRNKTCGCIVLPRYITVLSRFLIFSVSSRDESEYSIDDNLTVGAVILSKKDEVDAVPRFASLINLCPLINPAVA